MFREEAVLTSLFGFCTLPVFSRSTLTLPTLSNSVRDRGALTDVYLCLPSRRRAAAAAGHAFPLDLKARPCSDLTHLRGSPQFPVPVFRCTLHWPSLSCVAPMGGGGEGGVCGTKIAGSRRHWGLGETSALTGSMPPQSLGSRLWGKKVVVFIIRQLCIAPAWCSSLYRH